MKNKNYSKFSQHFKKKEQNDETEVVNQVVETVVKTISGIVTGCEKLNMRKEPNKDSMVIITLDKNTEIKINMEESTEDFYKVTVASGLEGYCMKNFVSIE